MGNQFDNRGNGDQNIVQGDNAVGKQVNDHRTTTQTIDGNENMAAGRDINITHIHDPAAKDTSRSLLPTQGDIFLHREEELSWLDKHLHPDKVVAICAPGGMGKTALAARALRSLPADRFPDPIISHTFYHQPATTQALQTIARALGIQAEADLEQQVAAALGSRQALLVLDGAEEANDLAALLRLRGTCGVLITTRKRTDCGALRLDLPPLPEEQAEEVLRAYSQVTGEEEAIQGIEKILGGWPVALRIAGHYLHSTGEPATDYLRWLQKRPFRKLQTGDRHQQDNAALLLERSVEQVNPDAVQVLRLAGVLAFAPLSLMSVMVVLSTEGEDEEELELRSMEAVNELVNYGLLERRKEGLHIGHALIHEYAAGQLGLGKEELKRVATFYIGWCEEQSEAGLEGYARMDGERVHCLRMIGACLERELWGEVKLLVRAIDIYLERQGWWTEQLAALEIHLTATRKAGDRKGEGWSLNSLGNTCYSRGKLDLAMHWYEQALPIWLELCLQMDEGVTLNNMALIYRQQGRYKEALIKAEQSLSIQQEVGYREGEGSTLDNIAGGYYDQKDYRQALQYYQKSLLIRFEVGDKVGLGETFNNIANTYNALGKPNKAVECHQQALMIFCELCDRAKEMVTCWNISFTYKDLGDLVKTEEYLVQAMQIAEAIDHHELERFRDNLIYVREVLNSRWLFWLYKSEKIILNWLRTKRHGA
ncbi:MAG: tetratricopeptide repeat protein [Candidatus Electrothrix aestuarii]|uniref:Tetratricopeptide repeat protein n=1 Tax=Candidatus Electrothrix aestuarii TaxID=3062594 RepID=A0AAU8LZ47_9BACT